MTVALIYEDFRAYPTPIIYVILSAQKRLFRVFPEQRRQKEVKKDQEG
jgi:hypothetical protein